MKKSIKKYPVKPPVITKVMEKEMPYGEEEFYSSIVSNNSKQLISKSREGMSMSQLNKLTERYDLSLKEISAILNISERTLQRYTDTDILSKDASDRAFHLQRLYERGAEVFGNLEVFKGWMKTSVLIFKNEKPISFLDTIFGFELIEQELGKIEHGIFA